MCSVVLVPAVEDIPAESEAKQSTDGGAALLLPVCAGLPYGDVTDRAAVAEGISH